MSLIAELKANNQHVRTEMGHHAKLERVCIAWCNKKGKMAVIKRYDKGTREPIILARYRHDGYKLHVEIQPL